MHMRLNYPGQVQPIHPMIRYWPRSPGPGSAICLQQNQALLLQASGFSVDDNDLEKWPLDLHHKYSNPTVCFAAKRTGARTVPG